MRTHKDNVVVVNRRKSQASKENGLEDEAENMNQAKKTRRSLSTVKLAS
jgi:hypothetical protein